ncbi:Oxygen-dependent choline dehydrogenase [Streptomyces violarus]
MRAERELLLCAGAIDTPRLLMLSGLGPADDLRGLGIDVRADLLGIYGSFQMVVLAALRARLKGWKPAGSSPWAAGDSR